MAVLTRERTAWLRVARFWFCRCRLMAERWRPLTNFLFLASVVFWSAIVSGGDYVDFPPEPPARSLARSESDARSIKLKPVTRSGNGLKSQARPKLCVTFFALLGR